MIGTRIGEYEIQERIGSGGMGVVYAALDRSLDRTVAIKVLSEFTRDEPRLMERLRREATAAASLKHPSTCQVIQFLAEPGPPALVMELVAGPPLHQRISEGPMPIAEVVALARRAAEGLAEAHAKGIVHRDIKPANILLTEDGRPKITDFGLAVLPELTRLTVDGSPVGTVAYMSPEQTQGADPSPRMDVWGLGVVLYEMLTGQHPFRASSPALTIGLIQGKTPVSPRDLRPEIPEELERIVEACLDRDPEYRPADGATLARALLAVEQALITDKLPHPGLRPSDRRRREIIARVSVAFGILLLLAGFVWRFMFGIGPDFPVFETHRLTKSTSWEAQPQISPDGTRVAYTTDIDQQLDIFITSTDGGRPFRVTTHEADDHSPAWIPGGTALLFVSDRSGQPGIWRTSQFGGDAALLVDGAADPAVSPDGEWIACTIVAEDGRSRIAVCPTANPEQLTTVTGSEDGLVEHASPAWAPDSHRIVYFAYDGLWVIDRTGAGATRIATGSDYLVDPVWSPDGRFIYFGSMQGQTASIRRVRADGGDALDITQGTGPEGHPSISASGQTLVYTTARNDRDLVIRDLDSGRESRLASLASDMMPALNEQGTALAFVSDRWAGSSDLWIQRLQDGGPEGEPELLLDSDLRIALPAFSPDGEWIAYYVIDADRRYLEVIRSGGGRPVRVTTGENDTQPAWTRDGRHLTFAADRNGRRGLWQIEVTEDGPQGEPVEIDTAGMSAWFPCWSPSGDHLAFIGATEEGMDAWVIEPDGELRRVTHSASLARISWGEDDSRLWTVGYWGTQSFEVRIVDVDSGDWSTLEPAVFGDPAVLDPSIAVAATAGILVFTEVVSQGDLWLMEASQGSF